VPQSSHAYAPLIDPTNHPLAPALALARMLEEHGAGTLPVSEGELPWCIEVDARVEPRPRAPAERAPA
jgi:hypothetical protein